MGTVALSEEYEIVICCLLLEQELLQKNTNITLGETFSGDKYPCTNLYLFVFITWMFFTFCMYVNILTLFSRCFSLLCSLELPRFAARSLLWVRS